MTTSDSAQLNMESYLADSEHIDWRHPLVMAKASELAAGASGDEEIAKRCFEFVRDSIKHSWDYRMNPVASRASEVLLHGTGYCYAKSHLLAALLRANGIPAGLCYQRLSVGVEGPPFCLHGLNAVHLAQYGWYRIDARGNKPGVAAEFIPPVEKLAFPVASVLEKDFPGIWANPLPPVISALTQNATGEQVYENLPDVDETEMIAAVSWDNRGMCKGEEDYVHPPAI
ncbi:MAG: transglutaminase family protein [Gallionella sp.]|jgi:transglutaminase-like putative cysteine protease|nr:transglutaminase family protein [Gallionella sp.]MCK9352838.1 transglutaminase family protein [Gallionella sp.]